jgi:hypothetical protein
MSGRQGLAPKPLSNGSHIDLNSKFLKNYSFRGFVFAELLLRSLELLLNLAWLLLALPACWLWRGFKSSSAGRQFTALQCLLVLGCVLVILFPVISATDDLHAMRAEMEESPASKHSIRHAGAEKVSAAKWQSPAALTNSAIPFVANDLVWLQLVTPSLSVPAAPVIERAARAPPVSLLA